MVPGRPADERGCARNDDAAREEANQAGDGDRAHADELLQGGIGRGGEVVEGVAHGEHRDGDSAAAGGNTAQGSRDDSGLPIHALQLGPAI